VPGLAFIGEGEFGHLLAPGTQVSQAPFAVSENTVKPAALVGQGMLIGAIENREFCVFAYGPLCGISRPAAMVLCREQVLNWRQNRFGGKN